MMPQNAFFLRTCDLLVNQKMMQRHFFCTLHPLSTVIFATATVLAFVRLRNSRFNFHCYTQREATPTLKSARRCTATSRDFSLNRPIGSTSIVTHSVKQRLLRNQPGGALRLLARKITKRIHSSKPASLNHPIGSTSIVIHSVKQHLLRNQPGSDAAISRDFLRKRLQRTFTRANQLH